MSATHVIILRAFDECYDGAFAKNREWTERLNAVIWTAFVGEYLYLFWLADNKRRFVRGAAQGEG